MAYTRNARLFFFFTLPDVGEEDYEELQHCRYYLEEGLSGMPYSGSVPVGVYWRMFIIGSSRDVTYHMLCDLLEPIDNRFYDLGFFGVVPQEYWQHFDRGIVGQRHLMLDIFVDVLLSDAARRASWTQRLTDLPMPPECVEYFLRGRQHARAPPPFPADDILAQMGDYFVRALPVNRFHLMCWDHVLGELETDRYMVMRRYRFALEEGLGGLRYTGGQLHWLMRIYALGRNLRARRCRGELTPRLEEYFFAHTPTRFFALGYFGVVPYEFLRDFPADLSIEDRVFSDSVGLSSWLPTAARESWRAGHARYSRFIQIITYRPPQLMYPGSWRRSQLHGDGADDDDVSEPEGPEWISPLDGHF